MASRRPSAGRSSGAVVPAPRGQGSSSLAAAAAGRGGMARSHAHTDAYMREMYASLEAMGVDTSDDPYKPSFEPHAPSFDPAHAGTALARGPAHELPVALASGSATHAFAPQPCGEWSAGPNDAAGRVGDASARPLLCLSVHGGLAVVGSSDHGLTEFDLRAGGGGSLVRRRALFSAACGHSEWVTAVAHAADGRVVSAGMDSKLCVWNASGAPRCHDLLGHTGSISRVAVSAEGQLALSASYDKTLRVWSLAGGAALACLRAHRAPVLHLAWARDLLASADRDGQVIAWDLPRGAPVRAASHGGHATALAAAEDGVLSGGQDGVVRLWDARRREPAAAARVHEGAVNELVAHALPRGAPLVLSAGADRAVLALEPRMGLQVLHRFTEHRDFVYSLAAVGPYALSGGGDGMVLVHELTRGELCYGLGANQAAVRCLAADSHRLVCAGDDGTLISYEFGAAPRREASGAPPAARQPAGSAAQQYAEKKRLAVERAAAIKAERKASQSAGSSRGFTPPDQLDHFMGGHAACGGDGRGEGGAFPPDANGEARKPPSELDMLHALGDRKFGRRR